MEGKDPQPTPPGEHVEASTGCPACEAGNREEAKFCGSCGVALTVQLVCASCGAEIPESQAFCDQCGAPSQGVAKRGDDRIASPAVPPIQEAEPQPGATDRAPSSTRESIGGGRYWFVRFLGEGATKHASWLATQTCSGRSRSR